PPPPRSSQPLLPPPAWAGDAKEWQDSGGVAGVAAQGGGDVAVAAGTQDADGEVAQAGHGPWGGAGAGLGGVLGEGDIADVVQRLDGPVTAHVVGQAGRVCLGGGEAGDRVHGHGPAAGAGEGPGAAGGGGGVGGGGVAAARSRSASGGRSAAGRGG